MLQEYTTSFWTFVQSCSTKDLLLGFLAVLALIYWARFTRLAGRHQKTLAQNTQLLTHAKNIEQKYDIVKAQAVAEAEETIAREIAPYQRKLHVLKLKNAEIDKDNSYLSSDYERILAKYTELCFCINALLAKQDLSPEFYKCLAKILPFSTSEAELEVLWAQFGANYGISYDLEGKLPKAAQSYKAKLENLIAAEIDVQIQPLADKMVECNNVAAKLVESVKTAKKTAEKLTGTQASVPESTGTTSSLEKT